MKKAHFGPFLNGLHSASNRSMGMRLPRDPSSARAAGAGKGGWGLAAVQAAGRPHSHPAPRG